MATIQMDLSTANRFVSSLSKSLQALCHGCMDFDTEIEIMGYININIDCGSKTDYVLNEKVSKSSGNSMKFVSNSFLAKKEEPKSCKDRSCSPIPEINKNNFQHSDNATSDFSRTHAQLYKSSGIYSPHSQVMRSSQKRQHTRDWRPSSRKSTKGAKSAHNFYNPNLQPEQTPSLETFDQVQVKTERFDEENQIANVNQEGQMFTDSFLNAESPSLSSDVNIKADPEDLEAQQQDSVPSLAGADDANDFPLQPSLAKSSNGERVQGESFKLETGDSVYSDSQNSGSAVTEQGGNDVDVGQGSSAHGVEQVAMEGESGQQDQTTHYTGDDGGEGPDFDVIEIDDEDEDLADYTDVGRSPGEPTFTKMDLRDPLRSSEPLMAPAITSPPRMPPISNSRSPPAICQGGDGKPGITYGHHRDGKYRFDHASGKYCCPMCDKQYTSPQSVQMHIKVKHHGFFRFYCKVCGRGFQRMAHFRGHMATHGLAEQYKCSVCGLQYAHETSLRSHIKLSH